MSLDEFHILTTPHQLYICCRRIRSLEAHVADIRTTQTAIQNTLLEIVAHLRGGNAPFPTRSPSAYPSFANQSPSVHSMGSPGMSTPSAGTHPQLIVDTTHQAGPQTPSATAATPSHASVNMINTTPRHHHEQNPAAYRSPPLSATGQRQAGPSGMQYSQSNPASSLHSVQGHPGNGPHNHPTTLPPFSSISGMDTMGPPRSQPANVSSVRYHTSGSKRAAPTSSNVTSADSTDAEEDDGELPASGLVAPWEVLRGLADVAIERAAQVHFPPIATPSPH